MTVERGSRLNNRYQIMEILGQGGMGSIYRAVDENLGVDVAVKENLFTTDEYARQFRREAIILANLRHPNLPRVTDHFVIEGQGQYLVMDFIEGEDLRERIDREGLLTDADTVILGAKICDALTYLHTRQPQVVHRDIKPGNVKITSAGNILLVDFGLAKVFTGGQATTTGARAMTPGYSPPEQYGTASTDHRSDIYSLGATLYMALTGTLPEDALARAMGQSELTPVRKYNPRVSRRLVAVIDKAMALRPEDRYQSAEEFKQALLKSRVVTGKRGTKEMTLTPAPDVHQGDLDHSAGIEVAGGNGSKRRAIPDAVEPLGSASRTSVSEHIAGESRLPRRKRRFSGCWLVGLLILSVVAVGALGVYRYRPVLAGQVIDWGTEMVARISVPGLFIPPSPTDTENSPLQSTGEVESATPEEPSPTVVAIGTTATARPRRTPTPRPTVTLTLSPTATPLGGGSGQIAYASDLTGLPQIYLMNADGTAQSQITDWPEGACQPAWSPDGLRIAFISPCASNQEIYPGASIFIISVDTEEYPSLPVTPTDEYTSLPVAPGGDFDPAWSTDGKQIAFTSLRDFNRAQIYVYDFEDKSVVSLSANTVRDSQPAWSPKGDRIAFITTRRGPYQIWIMDNQGGEALRISSSGSLKNSHPVWSPDGGVILFSQSEVLGGLPQLVMMRVQEENIFEMRLMEEVIPMREANYSPDGYWIVFESWPEGSNHDIYIMTPNGLARHQLTEEGSLEFDPAWRP